MTFTLVLIFSSRWVIAHVYSHFLLNFVWHHGVVIILNQSFTLWIKMRVAPASVALSSQEAGVLVTHLWSLHHLPHHLCHLWHDITWWHHSRQHRPSVVHYTSDLTLIQCVNWDMEVSVQSQSKLWLDRITSLTLGHSSWRWLVTCPQPCYLSPAYFKVGCPHCHLYSTLIRCSNPDLVKLTD